jgi:hypothetical protein
VGSIRSRGVDFIEGPIGRQGRVDAAVDRQCGKDDVDEHQGS